MASIGTPGVGIKSDSFDRIRGVITISRVARSADASATLFGARRLAACAILVALPLLAAAPPLVAQCYGPASIGGSGGLCQGVDMQGGIAYAMEHDRLTTFDVSSPVKPRPLGTVLLSHNFM